MVQLVDRKLDCDCPVITKEWRQDLEVNRILAEIDAQIEKLQSARALLAGTQTAKRPGPGRPKGSKSATTTAATPGARRKLSPEGRKRIADAMKRRWAERKKTPAKAS